MAENNGLQINGVGIQHWNYRTLFVYYAWTIRGQIFQC
jgi:hypothetical protein